MSNVDLSKAPEGFPIWVEDLNRDKNFDQSGWHADRGDRYEDQSGCHWLKSDDHAFRVHERPATLQWNGEGLPPVGTVCMVYPHNTLWGFSSTSGHRREILAYHGDFVWLGNDCMALESTRIDKVDFKPLRTPEQIAAEEREKAIKAMVDVLQVSDNLSGTAEYIVCGILHDAGYRKLEQPE